MWFHRFDTYYRALGPERSLTTAYNAWREDRGKRNLCASPAGSWKINAETWRWRHRAEAWDAHERRRRQREDEYLRRQYRSKRTQLLDVLCERVERAIRAYEPDGENLVQITQAAEKLVGMLRAEWGEVASGEPNEKTTPIRVVEVLKDHSDVGAT